MEAIQNRAINFNLKVFIIFLFVMGLYPMAGFSGPQLIDIVAPETIIAEVGDTIDIEIFFVPTGPKEVPISAYELLFQWEPQNLELVNLVEMQKKNLERGI